ncbi:ECF transporter S component [Streptomyces sp. NPDC050738]|uniref:ECF transporter S component n=1 Tax=Streptomyces sp. NPDC050738 TaxID=3154744 RepID=UPI003440B7CA
MSTVAPIRFGVRSLCAVLLVSAIGAMAFLWPLFADPGSDVVAHSGDAPWLFALLLPLMLAVVLATLADTGLGPKAVAMLGVLAAVGAALRPLGAGTAGIEPMFFLMVIAGRALGPGFGFTLGSLTMFASALLTGGVGPWMPFQMLTMGWVTMGAGLLPRAAGRAELWLLAVYGALAGFAYGFVMNLWGWPVVTGQSTALSYVAGAPASENLPRFLAYYVATSLGWDFMRAAVTAALCLLLGRPVLKALRRATRRAAFETQVTFDAAGT